jgi:hypothetical protein
VQNTVRQVFGALGVAVIGTLLATSYSAAAAETLQVLPDDARQVASQSVVATDAVLDAAVERGASDAEVEELRAAAFEDFLAASRVTSLLSATVISLAAVVVLVLLPAVPPPARRDAAPGLSAD